MKETEIKKEVKKHEPKKPEYKGDSIYKIN